MSQDTIFDKILKKEIPAKIIYEDDDVLAFHDIQPKAPIHVLVIPKVKIKSFAEVRKQEAVTSGKFINKISVIADFLGLEKAGYRVVFNCGENGGQTVDYIHAHIMGGKKMPFE